MATHTPGPWLDWDTLEWLHEPKHLLARTEDARLIAAAPELLDALADFCLSAESAAGCIDGASHDENYSEILSFAGSALASSYDKARGILAKVAKP